MMMSPRFEILLPDINGIMRGLSAPLADAAGLLEKPVSWSSSLFSSRFDGSVVEECGYGLSVGDPDFPLRAVPGSEAPIPWQQGEEDSEEGGEYGRQALYRMYRPGDGGAGGEGGDEGAPFELDPQHALQAVLDIMKKDGLNSILATEFEFYLSLPDDLSGGQNDGRNSQNNTLASPGFGSALGAPDGKAGSSDLYSLREVHRQEEFLSRVTRYAAAQNLPAGNIISEYGAGQWEVNLHHTDAMRAVLDGLLLRRLVHCTAAQCGKRATFMAKPYGESSGSGMHMHISLWKDGKNCFADEKVLRAAIAGTLAVTREAMAFFAPYDNSYRRFLPGSYAPCEASWGRENRSVAVRVPMAATDGEKRLEFRLCGADVNPILAAAALLAGIHWGISRQLAAPPPHESGGAGGGDSVPLSWREALDVFAGARILPDYFDERFLANYLCVKENEWRHHRTHVSDYDRLFYGREL